MVGAASDPIERLEMLNEHHAFDGEAGRNRDFEGVPV